MSTYTPQGVYAEVQQFLWNLGDTQISIDQRWEDMALGAQEEFIQVSENMNRLAQEATVFEHEIYFQKSEGWQETRTMLQERLSAHWKVCYFGICDDEPDGFLSLYFHTLEPISRFMLTPMCYGIPGKALHWNVLNKPVEKRQQ